MQKHIPIIILDFGSQFTQLIARKIREFGVFCEILPYDVELERIKNAIPSGIIFSGGPNSVNDIDCPDIAQEIYNLNIPILGVCYGMQMIAKHFGGIVESGGVREFGYAQLNVIDIAGSMFNCFKQEPTVWMSHGDKVSTMPNGFSIYAYTNSCPIAAIGNQEKQIYGIQFHAEVTHTVQGINLLKAFVLDTCKADSSWKMDSIIDSSVKSIRDMVGDKKVLLGLSGGVDSSVAAAIIHKAIGDQLTCVFVDNGLLRLNERAQVEQVFKDNLGVKVVTVDAREYFLKALSAITDPELKRKSIGKSFIDIFEIEANKIQDVDFLAQGTIYPDVIESAGGKKTAHTIKSHHNVGGLPAHMRLKLLEPLRDLFKDEVRQLGVSLGLPPAMVYRHPFPGPGLGVRILGEVKPQYVNLLQKADAIFLHELNNTLATKADAHYGLCSVDQVGKTWYELTSQAFAVFLPVKSVGVMGDGRTYDYVVALRAVQTLDFMTAHWARLPHDLLATVSNRIINEINGINRVTYDISGKPPATIEWE
jgi:GMP synthase (glutamine-hydrolysing)